VFVVCCVGSGLCDELITKSEESYRVCVCVTVCDLETSKKSGLGASWAVATQIEKKERHIPRYPTLSILL
jgi:hypothetical protein